MTGRERDELHEAVKVAVAEAHDEKLKELVEAELPLAIGEVLGPMIHAAVRADTRWYRRRIVIGFLCLFAGLGYLVHDNRDIAQDNRDSSTAARGVVCQIINGGDQSLYVYEQEKSITRRQLRRALRQSAEYRRLLGPAPECYPTLTPPPKQRRPAAPTP